MDIKALSLALGAVLLLAGCAANSGKEAAAVAQADTGAAGETQAAGGAGDEGKEKLICKDVVKTGTRFSEKVCATQAAWDGASEFGQKATEDIQRRPVYQNAQQPPGGG
jgi:hypothetical protein